MFFKENDVAEQQCEFQKGKVKLKEEVTNMG